ncbi:MAG TPA: Uma2 family endonuclease [Blastocatellia bacterium]|nr:Uma2 family endonuclease [Blastocatellia bacterium]
MSTQVTSYYEIVSQLPEDASVTFRDVSWDEYEELLEQVGEAPGLRITYDNGSLHVMTISVEHEKYSEFIKSLIAGIRLRLRLNILSFGSATMRKRKRSKGHEPDASFYVQSAALIGNRVEVDFETDPPPDIVVEIDVHHDSRPRFPVYGALAVPEIWRYDGEAMTIYHLIEDSESGTTGYMERETSVALPILSAQFLTGMLDRMRKEGELNALLAFDEWLQSRA